MKSDLAVETRAVCMVLIEEIFEVFDCRKEIERKYILYDVFRYI